MQSSSDELNPRSRRGSIHSISELGIRRPRNATQTFLGWSRTFSSLTRWELLYLVISLFSIVGAIGTTIERVVIIPKECDDVIIAVILLINSLFCLVYILRGIFFELPYELLVFVLTVVVVVIYVFISYFGFCPPPPNQVDSGKNSINTACDVTSCPIKLSRLIVASVVSPILICLGLFLISKQFSSWNLVFRSVGGASRLQSAAKLHYAFQSLLWFDFQTDISMVILCLRGGFQELNKTEVLILTIGSLYCVTTRVIAYFAIRRESLILCWIYWISFPVVPAYVIYELDTPATGVLDYGAAVLDKTAYFTGILVQEAETINCVASCAETTVYQFLFLTL
ncbi:unnamed protein product [Cyprideis torosa]|uniref:DUF7789 domain-containing protein n=1 Tax=Cyprideis torosa TaxID=163714 RepID=A0A7R8WBZ4_9CRUS|nr:unnamed protein product [Cyprideis torosa]CAG0890161.1 unnamed protein product [Cyprideis torosa]